MRADTHPPGMRPDYTFDFDRRQYVDDDHAVWHLLCERQKPLLKNRACREYLDALDRLGILTDGGILPISGASATCLKKRLGGRLVTVPGLIPGNVFLGHLARRQFPVTWWIRGRHELDYLKEPDIFHDLFGHVPLLSNPVFADYMQQFGEGRDEGRSSTPEYLIARLYWFTVEFGLIKTDEGLRIYGSGIVSSAKESVYALESPKPNRIGFDLMRIMRSQYRIDDVQETYFVIDSFEQLFEETRPDFTDYYAKLKTLPEIGEQDLLPEDKVITRGVFA